MKKTDDEELRRILTERRSILQQQLAAIDVLIGANDLPLKTETLSPTCITTMRQIIRADLDMLILEALDKAYPNYLGPAEIRHYIEQVGNYSDKGRLRDHIRKRLVFLISEGKVEVIDFTTRREGNKYRLIKNDALIKTTEG